MNRATWRQILVVLATLATIVVNGLANALPLNGLQTGEISDRFEVYFVPAGYVFSIWGLIYLGLVAYAIYQALPAQRENPRLRGIAAPYIWGSLANIAWIFLWHYEAFPLTILAMLILLVMLISIYLRLDVGRAKARGAENWCVVVPMSIYLGWITVATIANATSLLAYLMWDGWGLGAEAWAVIMLAAATLVAGWMSFTRRSSAYALVLVWAFAGIAIKHGDTPIVAYAAWVAALLVVFLLIAGGMRRRGRVAVS
jgi:hypothetical protein